VQCVCRARRSAIFLVLVGNSLAGVMPELLGSATSARILALLPLSANRLYTLAAWLCVVPTAWVPSLRQISWLSGAGVVLLLVLVSLLLWAAATALFDAHHDGHSDGSGSSWEEDGSGSVAPTSAASGLRWSSVLRERLDALPDGAGAWGALPCALAMIAFSFSCHNMVPGFEEGMHPAQRHQFPAVAGVTFCCCAVLKAVVMFAAWTAFGPNTPPVRSRPSACSV
jgi:amino acid permease